MLTWEIGFERLGINIDEIFTSFYKTFNNIVNKHAPVITFSKRMIKQFSKPLKTKGLRISIQTKNWLFQSGDFEKYKYYRNKICFLIRLIKKSYYHELFKNNLNDMRKTWQAVNALLNRRKRNHGPVNKLKDPQSTNNSVTNDPLRIPNIMNRYCSSVGNILIRIIPVTPNHLTPHSSSNLLLHMKWSLNFIHTEQ